MPTLTANGIDICYEQLGDPSGEPMLLISGLGAQLTDWPQGFLHALGEAGFFLTIFDNRDVGKSTWLEEYGPVDAANILFGIDKAPYLLADMADDAAGLVEAIGLGPVHVVGISLGGMVAQQFAIDYPELTRTLTSIMSTPAHMEVGQPTERALELLLRSRSQDFDEFLDQEVETWGEMAGSGYPLNVTWIRETARQSWERARNPDGVVRQIAAVVQSPDRRPLLSSVTVPALVLHGDEDPLITLPGGEATARALPEATFVVYPGMGHSLPEPLWGEFIREIGQLAERA
jgi:pimeloyl-ACP methyl ester carboxylesterase